MSKKVFGQSKCFIEDIDEKDRPSDPIILDAFNRIWQKLQSEIFIWDDFKTSLPFQREKCADNSEEKQKIRSREEQHRLDLQAMCFDEKGRRKKLNKQQLDQITQTARFTVKSEIDEQYDNVWLLGSFLQLGKKAISDRLKQRKKDANEYWFLQLPEAFSRTNPLALWQALNNMKNSLAHIVRVLLGLAEFRPRYSDHFIDLLMQKDRILYLFSELQPLADNELIWDTQNQFNLNTLLIKPQIVDQLKTIINKQMDILNEKGSIHDSALLLSIMEHPETRQLDPELPALLQRFHDFYFKLCRQNPRFDVLHKAEIEKREQLLIEQYPYRGRYQKWRKIKLDEQSNEIEKKVRQQLAEELLEVLSPGQEHYCLQRNMDYFSARGESEKNHLQLQIFPSKIFKLLRIKWSFKPLSEGDSLPVNKYRLSSKFSLWRIKYLAMFAYNAFFNNTLKLMRAWLYNPFGVKSVLTLSRDKFNGEVWLTAEGEPVGSGKYGTHLTDLYDRWKLLRRYRRDFEGKSDFGLFPRSVGRLFNRFYCYIMIGLIGSGIVMAFRYGGFIVLTLLVAVGLLLAPLLLPLFSLLVYAFDMLIYDHIGPDPYYNGRRKKPYTSFSPLLTTLFFSFLIRGLLYAAISVLGIIIYVLATPLLTLMALLAFALRYCWDFLIRMLFIIPFARIPGDNFAGLVQRISGYGIASEVLNQIDAGDAMEKYRGWLEVYILDEYEPLVLKCLHQSEERLEQMMTGAYSSIIGDHLYAVEEAIEKNINEFKPSFERHLYDYRTVLQNRMLDYAAHLIRLGTNDLPGFMQTSESLTQSHIESGLFAYMSDGQIAAYWSQLGVEKNEWSLLNRVLLNRAFSADIFTPMEACDGSIRVQNSQQNVVKSLIVEHEPSSKVAFNVIGDAQAPETAYKLAFDDNSFWHEFYHSLYLPVETPERWQYLMRLRQRYLIKQG